MRPVGLLTFVVAVAVGSVLPGQSPPRLSAIDAVITDTALVPVAGVTVALVGTTVRLTTGLNGRFLIHGLPGGRFQLTLQKLGYRSISSEVDIGDADTLRLSFTLESGRSQLERVTVTERGRSLRLAQFDERREKGGGQYMTADDIAKRNTPFATELMRTLKGMNVKPYPDGAGGVQYFAMSTRSGTRDAFFQARKGQAESYVIGCPMEVYIDGIVMPTPFNLDHLPPPSAIEGVELYSGPAMVPLKFGGTERRCGVVLIWTKDGS